MDTIDRTVDDFVELRTAAKFVLGQLEGIYDTRIPGQVRMIIQDAAKRLAAALGDEYQQPATWSHDEP